MKKIKKITLAFVLASSMMLSSANVFARGISFKDVKNTDWFYTTVIKLAENNVIK